MLSDLLNNTGFVAIICALFGGAGLSGINKFMDRNTKKTTEASQIRDELRKEIESLRSQLATTDAREEALEKQIDEWKEKYYDTRDELAKRVTELQILTERLKGLLPDEKEK